MNFESLQSQLEELRAKTLESAGRNDKATSYNFLPLMKRWEKMASSAAKEIIKTKAIIESEQRSYQVLFKSAEIGYLATDLRGIICETNAISSKLLGIPENKLVGKALSSFVTAKERSEFHLNTTLLADGSKKSHRWETIFIRKSKQKKNVIISASAIEDHQGVMMGLRWLIQDITEHREIEELVQYKSEQLIEASAQHKEVEQALRLSRNQISVILSGIADGITVLNTKEKIIYANEAAAHMIGYANAEELTSMPADRATSRFEIFDESGSLMAMNELPGRMALLGEESSPKVVRFRVLKTREERWSLVKAKPVRNEAGQVVMSVSIFHDITDLKRSELAQRLLAETSQVLAEDLGYEVRMSNLAKLLVPRFADWCAIDILNENKKLQRVSVIHTDPQMIEWAHELYQRYPPDPASLSGPYDVIRTKQSQYIPLITEEMIDAVKDSDQRDIVLKLGLSSLMIIPLSARDHTFGVLTLVWSDSHHSYTPDDLILAEEMARRAALALENARLYNETKLLNVELEQRVNIRTAELEINNKSLVNEIKERKAVEEQFRQLTIELEQRVVERTQEMVDINQKLRREIFERELVDGALRSSLHKMSELYKISQSIGLASTPDELLQVLLSSSLLDSTIRASIAIFEQVWKRNEPRPTFCTILTAWNKQPETLLYIGQKMTLAEYGVFESHQDYEPLIITDINNDPRVNDVMRQRLTNINVVGSFLFPLTANGECYGILSLHFGQIITLNTNDLRHLQGLVDEIAVGIHNFRLLETEAQARHEAEEANTVKLKFLAMISHELRTPLTSIKGFSTTLLADDVEWNRENQRDFIETISSEADKLSELIEQLLNLSRLEAGTLQIAPNHTTWTDILSISLVQLNSLVVNHKLVMEVPESELPTLNVDMMRVSQVLTNLVNNAVKYSPEGTTITISAEMLSSQFIKVRVIDEGNGIPPEARTRIFDAFQQLDRQSQSIVQGVGLGLAICRGLIEGQSGRIWVDNHEGPGTTMSFTLPIAV